MVKKLRHAVNHAWRIESLAILVTVLSITVASTSQQPSLTSVGAASFGSGVLSMAGGERTSVRCNGSRLNMTRQTASQISLDCLPYPSPTPTRVPPSPTPIPPTVIPTGAQNPTVTPTKPSSSGGSESMAMMAWGSGGKNAPNPKYDKCEDGTDIVLAHRAFSVVAPDGKTYPTWHAPVVTNPITGKGKCFFGHDHGRDPKGYAYWDEVKKHFAYDSNGNGLADSAEISVAGIPFGYVNEQMDLYSSTNSLTVMRHEDHVGHKVEFANGEGDIGEGTDPFDTNKSGGVVVPVKNPSGSPKWNQSGIRCYHFHKIHQGVSTPDALTNNLHEIVMHTKCVSTRSDYPSSTSLISGMLAFGAPGEFTAFCEENRNQIIRLGTTSSNQNWPGSSGNGQRNIITRDCVEQRVLVPAGQWSGFPYEIWDGQLAITTADGREIARNGGAWEVLDAIRYYNPSSPNKISYTASWCYETLGDRRTRGGDCDWMTNYGQIRDITWDDPRSAYRGIHRGQYINPHTLNNAGGSEIWYTDPFGGRAQTTYFPGSVKQQVSRVNARIQFDVDPRITLRYHDDGGDTVHAPN